MPNKNFELQETDSCPPLPTPLTHPTAVHGITPHNTFVFFSKLVLEDADWIPEGDGYSLYLRPAAISTHVRPTNNLDVSSRFFWLRVSLLQSFQQFAAGRPVFHSARSGGRRAGEHLHQFL